MTLKEVCEIADACGLKTLGEAVMNAERHYDALVAIDDMDKEFEELYREASALGPEWKSISIYTICGSKMTEVRTMTDKLIKDLHEGAEFLESSTPGIKNSFAKMCHDAADVIEKLSKPNNKVHLCSSCTYTYPECPCKPDDVIFGNNVGNDNICACAKYAPKTFPTWISTKIELPQAYEEVFLKFTNNQASGFIDRDGCWFVYSDDDDGFYTEVADNESKPTHWAKKLPETIKE